MKEIYKTGSLTFYEYKPTILKPFYVNLEPLTLRRRIRLILAYFSKFKVYYLKEDDHFVGYCLVQSGKDSRYKFATEEDIIVGPYFVVEKFRGRKFSIILLDYILKQSDLKFNNAYDYIHKNNTPSIKASEAVGFQYMSDANISKYLRQMKLCTKGQGEYLVFRYQAN